VTQEVDVKTIVRLVTVSTIAVLCMAAVGSAHTETKIRFSLDWIPGSVHSPFFIALYKGYYQAEGLDVVIDRGKGSVGLVQQMASGVYDMGFPTSAWSRISIRKIPTRPFPC
jgi:NitT/TauT family transport system substrate-binding protein